MKRHLLLLILALFITACSVPVQQPERVAQEGLILKPLTFEELTQWSDLDFKTALESFFKSCAKSNNSPVFNQICQQEADTEQAEDFFRSYFQPFLWVDPESDKEGLITGYYEPLLEGRLTKDENFTVPLLSPPSDLVRVYLDSVIPELKGKTVRGRLVDGKIVPYYSRAEITTQEAPENVICWVKDKVDLFFLQIQGSGRIKIDENQTLFVGYGDKNGYPYQSIGNYMIENKIMPYAQMSLQGIKAWAQSHPDAIDELLNQNPSYLFFIQKQSSAKGAQGVVLTPQHSVAVDTRYIPFGTPMFLHTRHPLTAEPFSALAIAQDKGAAIKGERRVDFFWGFGEEAANLAGHTKSRGKMILLLPKGFHAPI